MYVLVQVFERRETKNSEIYETQYLRSLDIKKISIPPPFPSQTWVLQLQEIFHLRPILGVCRLRTCRGLGFALACCAVLAGARCAVIPSDGFQEL